MIYVFLAFLAFDIYAAVVSLSINHFIAAILFAVATVAWGLMALFALPENN